MFKNFRMAKPSLRLTVLLAVFIALGIIVGNFLSFGTNIMQVSFSFIVNSVMGAFAGSLWTGLAMGIADVVGTLMFGHFGYFPGFTFSAVIVGILYGLFFFRKKLAWSSWKDWLYVLVAMTVIMLVDTVFFNTLWVSMLFPHHAFKIYLMARLPLLWQIPLRTVVVMLIIPALQRIPSIKKILL
ncbi:MAG: folate family ECF transporter S component [Streptococcaceae bacterium]|jgi:ECF transporter S component (folate family)|nr:folate family ECF transporter S component [Streptococcaceae bacterium]